jgi:hypothetical protein
MTSHHDSTEVQLSLRLSVSQTITNRLHYSQYDFNKTATHCGTTSQVALIAKEPFLIPKKIAPYTLIDAPGRNTLVHLLLEWTTLLRSQQFR